MNNILFVLIDTMDLSFYLRYKDHLTNIHQNLLHKLQSHNVLVVGYQDSMITNHKFTDSKKLYSFIAQQSAMRDIVICDAFAGMLSLADTELVVNYMRSKYYDICLTENLPEGLVPMVISHEFIIDLPNYIEENQKISSSIKTLINWEYKGIDVGIYLSDSLLVMERIDFLPVNQGSISYIEKLSIEQISVANIEKWLIEYPELLRNIPQYLAIELSSDSDGFHAKKFSNQEMDFHVFRSLVTQIDEVCPEALISIGIWNEPFTHTKFKEIFKLLLSIPNRILIESRSLLLSQELVDLVLSRPNTELIFDVSFTNNSNFAYYKKNQYTLDQIAKFIKSLPNKDNVWIRLTRSPETEENIAQFFKEWKEFVPRILIIKADSFGNEKSKVVDLAPLKRHACYALRRELIILNNGQVLLCRQSDKVIGDLTQESLLTVWKKNNFQFEQQKHHQYNTCAQCNQCDDWWVWN